MKALNKTKNTQVATDLKVADSPIDKFLGLLRKSNPRSLLFQTRFGVHTLFLQTPIDIIVINKRYEVTKTKTVRPNRFFLYNPKYPYVLELPKGTVQKSKTKIGDRIVFSDKIN